MRLIVKLFFIAIIALSIPEYSHAEETPIQKETRLRAELTEIEKEQAETQKILDEAKSQSSSLKRDILILDTRIKAAELNIRAKNLIIQGLGKDITKKEQTIGTLVARIDRGRESLAQIMRKTNEIGTISFPEVVLAQETVTGIFLDLDNFYFVQQSLKTTFEEIRNVKAQTENEKNTLDKKRNSEVDARQVIQQERKSIASNQGEKQRLLNISKGNEKTYSAVLADKQRKAAEIRAALFSLRDSDSIKFEVALKYANEANKATGIRPAFLLAVFAQESGLTQDSTFGKQVGSCYLTDPQTGAGASVKSGSLFAKVMHPDRDVPPFITITKSLGLEYTKTLVSCPQAVGWGGAMGPAQFIPSTWILYISGIQRSLGIGTPNPWNPEHAFVAASLLLVDNGAVYGSYTAEQNAACKYYSGRSCSASAIARIYGNQVMAKADMIERTMIDPLQGI